MLLITSETKILLKEKLRDNFISRNNLLFLGFEAFTFFWGQSESHINSNKPTQLKYLQTNLNPVISNIRNDLCEKVMINWAQQIHSEKCSRGK